MNKEPDEYPRHRSADYKDRVRLWSCGAFLSFVIFAVLMAPLGSYDRNRARSTSCLSNLKQQALAALQYSTDYDDRMPEGSAWADQLGIFGLTSGTLNCPELHSNMPASMLYGYAYNDWLSKTNLTSLASPQTTALTYDSTKTHRNANDFFTSFVLSGRHNHSTGSNLSFADGHAKFKKESEFENLKLANMDGKIFVSPANSDSKQLSVQRDKQPEK